LAAPAPATLRGEAFGAPVEIVVRDLPSGAQAAAKALAGIAEVERMTDCTRPDGGLAALNAAAGRGPQTVEARLFSILSRAHSFCVWSEQAYGPLGRDLNALWGVRSKPPSAPEPPAVTQAAAAADCARLTLDADKSTAALAEGSGLDLWGLAEGFAVDRAIELLKEAGAANAFVRIGSVRRGAGAGPAERGWPVALEAIPGMEGNPSVVFLRDQALAMTLRGDRPVLFNHRNGRPTEGTLAVAAVSQLAADAQALATILFVAGPREGQMRLGSLSPRPSVLWFMGSGEGAPLQVDYRWSQVPRR
jgi:thiamine biosynthesis lipoprotein